MEGLKTETVHRNAAPKETETLKCHEGTWMNHNATAAELAAAWQPGAGKAVLARAAETGEALRKALEDT